jgi:hypothetical protein
MGFTVHQFSILVTWTLSILMKSVPIWILQTQTR